MTVLKRSTEIEAKKLRPGEYIQYKHLELWVLYKCPKCGLVTTLGKKYHDVDYAGSVLPAAHCPHKLGGGSRCTFTDSLTLDGWLPETKGSA